MRLFTFLLCICLSSAFVFGQINQPAAAWQEDLAFLQKTVHEEYPFLFKKISAPDFDAAVKTLHDAIPQMEEHEIVVGFARIVSSFGYGHTSLWVTGWSKDNAWGFHQMPYSLYHFSDGVYIQAAPERYAAAVGAKVLKVAGVPVQEALQAVRPVVPAENDQFFKAYGWHYLGTPEVLHAQGVTKTLMSNITLTLEKNGKVFEQTFEPFEGEGYPGNYSFVDQVEGWVSARDQSSTPLWLQQLDRIYFYEYLPEQKAVYIRHSQIQDDEQEAIPAFYERVFQFVEENDVEKLILDVRLNGGGNNYKNKPIVTGVIQSKINQPGKFFVVLGRRTYSACQNLVNELHTYTEAVFVGEPTAENINFYGDNRTVELPNSGLKPRLSFAWWQDKPQWENQDWLPPHLATDLSFAQYAANEDPALDVIWEYKDDSAIVDPMTHLEGLFLAGKMDQIAPEAKRMLADPRYQYYPFEDRLNRAGYQLLGDDQLQPAVFVFQLVTELFPDSANAWDSLAEAHWRSGDLETAKELYNKAISMDPDGPTGDNARSMLEEIKKGE